MITHAVLSPWNACTTAQQSVQLGKATTTTVLTWGGSGVGSAVREGALASLLYHQSRNCRKNTPTERPVDRAVAAPCRTLLDNVLNQLRDLGRGQVRDHLSKISRSNTPTYGTVDRVVAAPGRTLLDNNLNQLGDLGRGKVREVCQGSEGATHLHMELWRGLCQICALLHWSRSQSRLHWSMSSSSSWT